MAGSSVDLPALVGHRARLWWDGSLAGEVYSQCGVFAVRCVRSAVSRLWRPADEDREENEPMASGGPGGLLVIN